jgi:hypothetical protein
MTASLRERLIGTWQLVSCIELMVDTGEERHPMGIDPIGYIMYAPGGCMSVQLARAGRDSFAGDEMLRGAPQEYVAAACSYIAYAGRFHVDECRGIVEHVIDVSLFPNWTGQHHRRLVKIDGDILGLAVEQPVMMGGEHRTASLRWRRAGPDAQPYWR